MVRVVGIHSGKQVTLAAYVRAWKAVKAAPARAEFKESLCGWWPERRETILRQYMQGLHDRINRRIAGFPGVLRPVGGA